jgi:hypothetical protein
MLVQRNSLTEPRDSVIVIKQGKCTVQGLFVTALGACLGPRKEMEAVCLLVDLAELTFSERAFRRAFLQSCVAGGVSAD